MQLQAFTKLSQVMECVQRTCVQPEDKAFVDGMKMKVVGMAFDSDVRAVIGTNPDDTASMMDAVAKLLRSKKIKTFVISYMDDYSKYMNAISTGSMKARWECMAKDCNMDAAIMDKMIDVAEATVALLNDPGVKRSSANLMKSYANNIQKMKKVRAVVSAAANARTVVVKKTKK